MSASEVESSSAADRRRDPRMEQLGSTRQLRIASHEDLEAILSLDEALWIATTAPTSTIRADSVFLQYLDSDDDGRLRADEVKAAIRHLLTHLRDWSGVDTGSDRIALAAIDRSSELGESIHASGVKMRRRYGGEDDIVSLSRVRVVKDEILSGGLDEAGIVLPEAAGDEDIKGFVVGIIDSTGGRMHSSGGAGVDSSSLDAFLEEGARFVGWLEEANPPGQEGATEILPLGPDTAGAYETLHALEAKLTQYFLLCDVKRVNPALLQRALETPEGQRAINLFDVAEAESYLADAPLAAPDDEGLIGLERGQNINPHFRKALEEFEDRVVRPLLGEDIRAFDKAAFRRILSIFDSYVAWLARKPDVRVEGLGDEKLRRFVGEAHYRETVRSLIDESHRTAFILENIRELEKLILYQANLLELVRSFVSFPHLYDPDRRALFEMGTLVMDGRHFSVAVKVLDRELHKEASTASNFYVMYLEVYGSKAEKAYEIAVPVTSGSRGNLRLHKWGIFNDVDGGELHARIVDIVENPISLTEAVLDPFARIARSVIRRLEEFSSQAEEKLKSGGLAKVEAPSSGAIAGGGIAVAALGSSFAFATKTLAAVSLKHILIALAVIAAIVAIPAGLAAWYKLARRDLSAILEGSGWGLNARMRLTRDQARQFTWQPNRTRMD